MFIQTEATPNPDTVKFLPGPPVAGHLGPFDYPDAASARASLLARALFQVDGVDRVFLGSDFVSISKTPSSDWKQVKPMVLAAIMDQYMAGLPVAIAFPPETPDASDVSPTTTRRRPRVSGPRRTHRKLTVRVRRAWFDSGSHSG